SKDEVDFVPKSVSCARAVCECDLLPSISWESTARPLMGLPFIVQPRMSGITPDGYAIASNG
ncbi:hypothetical protein, partial [Salmonella enterica]|uniref:hypothetical protein n=1 Tax=Salmonella enterica TaxID=28901 RepID=UPI001A9C4004